MSNGDVQTKVTLLGDATGATAAVNQVSERFKLFTGQVTAGTEVVSGFIEKLSGFAAAAAAGFGFAKMIGEANEWNMSAMKISKTMGISSEEASVYAVALHGLGIDHEMMDSAALKLSRTLAQGTDKFDAYGITVKDAHGNLLPMPQIMANVNQALLNTQSGTDRNVMAMSLYGRSWGELQQILRLTPAAMEEAAATAERLHLIVGPEGIAKTLEYRKNLNEVKLVGESLAISLDNELIPELIRLSAEMGHTGSQALPGFILGLHSIEAEITRVAQLIDLAGGTLTSFGSKALKVAEIVTRFMTIGQFGDSFKAGSEQMDEWNKNLEARFKEKSTSLQTLANLEAGLDANGNPIKRASSSTGDGDRVDPGTKGGQDLANQENAARTAYLAYEKTFYETQAQMQKNANAAMEEQNRTDYEWGLTDLQSYLDKKHRLNQNSLQIELIAKQKELTDARAAEDKANRAYNLDPTGNAATNVNKAYDTTQKAIMAVQAAQAKLTAAKAADAEETKKLTTDTVRSYREQQAAFLEMQNNFAGAAAIRQQLAEEDQKRLQLIADAMTGNEDAMRAYWAAEAADQMKSASEAFKQVEQYQQLNIQLLELAGSYEEAAKARKELEESNPTFSLLPKDIQEQKKELSDSATAQGKLKESSQTQSWLFGNQEIRNKTPDIFGNTAGPQADLLLKYQQEAAGVQAEIETMNALYQQDTENYAAALEKKKLLDAQYSAEKNRLDVQMWTSSAQVVQGQLGQIAGMMNKGNKDQFDAWKALAMSQAVISTALAVAGILGAEAKLGVLAIPLAMTAGAIGAAQIGIIAGEQYKAREMGGDVEAGQSYIVGEKRPELFTPGVSGTITPFVPQGSNSATIHQTLNITGVGADIETNTRAIAKQAADNAKLEILNSMNRGGEFALASGRIPR